MRDNAIRRRIGCQAVPAAARWDWDIAAVLLWLVQWGVSVVSMPDDPQLKRGQVGEADDDAVQAQNLRLSFLDDVPAPLISDQNENVP